MSDGFEYSNYNKINQENERLLPEETLAPKSGSSIGHSATVSSIFSPFTKLFGRIFGSKEEKQAQSLQVKAEFLPDSKSLRSSGIHYEQVASQVDDLAMGQSGSQSNLSGYDEPQSIKEESDYGGEIKPVDETSDYGGEIQNSGEGQPISFEAPPTKILEDRTFRVLESNELANLKVFEKTDQSEAQVAIAEKADEVAQYLLNEGKGLIEDARKEGKILIREMKLSHGIHKLIVNPNGRIYMEVGSQDQKGVYKRHFAEGEYKTVGKMVRVATYTLKTEPLEPKNKVMGMMKALSDEVSHEQRDEIEYEKMVNFKLLEMKKEDKSALSKVECTKQSGDLLVGDFAPLGNLEGYARGHRENLPNLCGQMAEAVGQLHNKGILHRDLKPDNFLVYEKDGKVDVRVTDFGKATMLLEGEPKSTASQFALFLLAPEALGRKHSTSSDIYQLGVSFALMWMGYRLKDPHHPFRPPRLNEETIDWKTWKERKEDVRGWLAEAAQGKPWSNVPGDVQDFILKMVAKDPAERPSAKDVEQFFKDR